ncbi:MAG: aminopeptidase [Saprospiraceae bacterium]|nr:aminopeptidase [Saprospiraceae bacterium]
MEMWSKYASLLSHYCLSLKEGDRLFIAASLQAEPLVKEVYREACRLGVVTEIAFSFSEMNRILVEEAPASLINTPGPFQAMAMKEFDAYLAIRAPFNLKEDQDLNKEKQKQRLRAFAGINNDYFDRTASGALRRCLCQFPTHASAQEAGMSQEAYSKFVFNACKLYEDDPIQAWKDLGKSQQNIVDHLNGCDEITYLNERSEIHFSVRGRTWINSDGKANMPSGEVFTGPVENSVTGSIYFDYPSIYNGNEVRGITLEVQDGLITRWSAELGQAFLDHIMDIEGARMFGEVAVGTNYGINRATKNILFDEKIGGTIHMAVGQSYKQTGGLNESTVHWDMIAGMQQGKIIADGMVIYENGHFII